MASKALKVGTALYAVFGTASIFYLFSKKSFGQPSGSESPFQLIAGKTYQLVMQAVGGKIAEQDVKDTVAVLSALGTEVQQTSLNDSSDTLTIVMKAGRNGRIVLNKFTPNPANPATGAMITSATEVA
jgi:hypothetical protein